MYEALKETLFASIEAHRDETVELLKKTISFPTTAGREGDAQRYYAGLLEELGMEVDVFETDLDEIKSKFDIVTSRETFEGSPMVVGYQKGCGEGKSLILCGHMDVVPASSHWKYDPFHATQENGRIYGRGASDMKAGVVSNYMVAKLLKKHGVRLKGDLIMQYCIDEETGSAAVLGSVVRGTKADGLIVTEPTNRSILIGTIGATWFRIKVKGKSAHASKAYTGINAIEKAYLIYEGIKALEQERAKNIESEYYKDKYMPYCINVGKFHAEGATISTVPDLAVLEGRFGFSPSETLQDVRDMLEGVIDEVCRNDEWLAEHRPQAELFGASWYGAEVPRDNPLLKQLIQNCDAVYQQETPLDVATYCSDGAQMQHWLGVPSITFGPGNIAQAHGDDEYVEIEELILAQKALIATVLDWCGVEE
jgi:acetylornithine deacetylase